MQLWYGTYAFPVNSVEIKDDREMLWNEGGQAYAFRRVMEVSGYLYSSGVGTPAQLQTEITLKMSALATALGVPNKLLVLRQDDNAVSATLLTPVGSTSGVRLLRGPNFRENQGGEYSVQRKFEFTMQAEYPMSGSQDLLISFKEVVTYGGGGPTYVYVPNILGDWQKQLAYPRIPYQVTQRGEAVGYRKYPEPPLPLFPGALMKPGDFQKTMPLRTGGIVTHTQYAITWQYEFMSTSPLLADPTLWK